MGQETKSHVHLLRRGNTAFIVDQKPFRSYAHAPYSGERPTVIGVLGKGEEEQESFTFQCLVCGGFAYRSWDRRDNSGWSEATEWAKHHAHGFRRAKPSDILSLLSRASDEEKAILYKCLESSHKV